MITCACALIQGVCVVYDILLQMRADPKDVLRFKVRFITMKEYHE